MTVQLSNPPIAWPWCQSDPHAFPWCQGLEGLQQCGEEELLPLLRCVRRCWGWALAAAGEGPTQVLCGNFVATLQTQAGRNTQALWLRGALAALCMAGLVRRWPLQHYYCRGEEPMSPKGARWWVAHSPMSSLPGYIGSALNTFYRPSGHMSKLERYRED